jgi:hypothetical protein
MEYFVRSFKVFWRSERLLKQNEIRLTAQKIQLNALAGFVAVFGLVMLTLAVFFALVPYMGQALAALTVSGVDLALAGALLAYGRSLKPAPEVEMAREMRDMALSNIEDEVAKAEAELVALKNDVHKLIRNPVDVLLPHAIGPLVTAVTRGLGSVKK